jgi:hypothetical protein
MYFCPYFLYFLIDLDEICYISPVISLSHYEFMKISKVKAIMCLGNKENCTHVFYNFVWLVTILCRRLACNSIKQFQILWKSVQWKPYFTYKNKWNFAHIFYIFHLICITFFRRDIHKILLICESWLNESHTLLREVNDFLSILSTFIVRCGWNSVEEVPT